MLRLPRRAQAPIDIPPSIDVSPWIGTDEQYRWLGGLVAALFVLNLLDAILTIWWVRLGLAVEANLFLRDLAHDDPIAFFVVKFALVSLGSLFLWRCRERPLAVVAIFTAFLLYYLVLLHHLRFSSLLMGHLVG